MKHPVVKMWECPQCGRLMWPSPEDEDGPPECNHGMFFEDPSLGASASEMRMCVAIDPAILSPEHRAETAIALADAEETFDKIEDLIDDQEPTVDVDRIYDLIMEYRNKRSQDERDRPRGC